jgi:hypothetical protein
MALMKRNQLTLRAQTNNKRTRSYLFPFGAAAITSIKMPCRGMRPTLVKRRWALRAFWSCTLNHTPGTSSRSVALSGTYYLKIALFSR